MNTATNKATVSNDRDAKNSVKIVALRMKHGGEADRCPACTRSPDAPYRRLRDGVIVEGCVDAAHTGRLSGASNEWHVRPVARAMRAERLVEALAL